MKEHRGRPGFMVYHEQLDAILPVLTMEQRGRLFTELCEFSRDFDHDVSFTDDENGALRMAFSILATSIRSDDERYRQRCEQNRRNRVGTIDNDGQRS